MKSSSSKQGAGISGHMLTLHQRVYHALNLGGLRSYHDRERKWQCTDIEIQRLVVRSIDAFLDCVTTETSQHPLVKDSVADMVGALEGILHFKKDSMLSLASTVVVKMVNALPGPLIQSHMLDIVRPLSSLLSSHQLQVSLSCTTALSSILSDLSTKKESEIWEILRETETVANIVHNIKKFPGGTKPIEYLQETVSLLSKILRRWPSSRFCVWNDTKLLEALDSIILKPNISVKVSVLQLYSTIALCGNGAERLLENGRTCLQMMVHCMGYSDVYSVQMEGFKLAQCFAISERGCLKMLKMCCKPLIQAIISVMRSCSVFTGKLSKDRMSVLLEACRLAMTTTRLAGEHQYYFRKFGIDRILLDLLLNNSHKNHELQHLSLVEQIDIAKEGLHAKSLLLLRPYIWDILGYLATHWAEDTNAKIHENKNHINMLIICTCLSFMESFRATRQICPNDINEPASRAVLLMIYSPSKYIASQTRHVLSEIMNPNDKDDLQYLLKLLDAISSEDKFKLQGKLQMVVNLISLACFVGLPQYRKHIIRCHGIKKLLGFLSWWLGSPFQIKRSSAAFHLYYPFEKKTCCYNLVEEGWEGEDMVLLFGLCALAELLHHSNDADVSVGWTDYSEAQLVSQLQEICSGPYAPGPRWYAAYALTHFGHYGFPNELGKVMSEVRNEIEYNDLKLVFTNQESLSVHAVVLMVRCPALLPPGELFPNIEGHERVKSEVRLSSHVDPPALLKLLEYIYSGYVQAGEEDLVKKLKILAKHCKLHYLFQLLCRSRPKWATPVPSFHLKYALGQAGHHISDIILEAKADELLNWECSICCQSAPHMHVDKVILCSRCGYLRALFRSGMQDSKSQTVKVPVSWKALVKLVDWFYSGLLPHPVSGCLWDNLDAEEKLHELVPYLELCSLAEFWLHDNLHEDCSRVIISYLDSATYLSIKILKLAADLSQWKLTEVAADYVAPLYHRLRISGELDELDDDLIDMVRAASVRLSQKEGDHNSC